MGLDLGFERERERERGGVKVVIYMYGIISVIFFCSKDQKKHEQVEG